MRRLVALLMACSGCDVLFGLHRDGTIDAAPADARDGDTDSTAAPSCTGRNPAPLYCFDFDGPTLMGYEQGVTFVAAPMTQGVIAERRAPAKAGPNGMWFTAAPNGFGLITRSTDSLAYHQLAARFWIRGEVNSGSANTNLELFEIALDASGKCRAAIFVEAMTFNLTFDVSCANGSAFGGIGQLANAWTAFDLSFDPRTGHLEGHYGGVPFQTTIPPAAIDYTGAPSILFGLVPSEIDLSIGFDEIEVTGQ